MSSSSSVSSSSVSSSSVSSSSVSSDKPDVLSIGQINNRIREINTKLKELGIHEIGISYQNIIQDRIRLRKNQNRVQVATSCTLFSSVIGVFLIIITDRLIFSTRGVCHVSDINNSDNWYPCCEIKDCGECHVGVIETDMCDYNVEHNITGYCNSTCTFIGAFQEGVQECTVVYGSCLTIEVDFNNNQYNNTECNVNDINCIKNAYDGFKDCVDGCKCMLSSDNLTVVKRYAGYNVALVLYCLSWVTMVLAISVGTHSAIKLFSKNEK